MIKALGLDEFFDPIDGDDARRDAFCALLYGMATAFAAPVRMAVIQMQSITHTGNMV